MNRAVALKASFGVTTDPEQLLREARALAQLRHPSVVAVYDVAVLGRSCFVVSELLPGPSLALWLDERKPAALEAVQIAAAIADALAHAHSRGIVHRDVEAEIEYRVFAEGLRPVLVDFGLALSDLDVATERRVVALGRRRSCRRSKPAAATGPDGVPPTARPRRDTLRDALRAGARFADARIGRHSAASSRRRTPAIASNSPDLPPELERVCPERRWRRLPADRYTTAADFAEALRHTMGLLPPLSLPSPQASTSAFASPLVVPAPPPPMTPAIAPVRPVPPASLSTSTPRSARSERRQITLLQCAFESQSGEDDPMEKVAEFQALCAAEVAAHGGLPLQASGTAFLACFGYPIAREDAPRQAVRAALAITQRSNPPPAVAGCRNRRPRW